MERHNNSLLDFSTALMGSESSSSNPMAWNKRYSAITLNRSLISSSYMEEGIIQVMIDQPVDDAFRGGITIKCDELDSDDLKKLYSEMENMELLNTYAKALKWMRLYGGAGIIVNVGQDLAKPLDIKRIKETTPLNFIAADRWELSFAPSGMGALDQLYLPLTEHPYNYYGHSLHQSNVLKLMGKDAPSMLRGQFGGWGMSELEKIVRSFNQFLKHQNVTYELLDEAKVDIFSIEGFNSAISTRNGAAKTAERIGLAAQIKNFQNALVIDKNDSYETKQITFSGLAEILTQIRIGLACDLRMPMTKLYGISAAGFNSGEDDIENYNCMVETEIRSKVRGPLIVMLNILCQKIFDYIPETLSFDWHPLREMSSQEQSVIKTEELNRTVSAFTNGLITSDKAIEILNHGEIFGVDLPADEAMSLEDVTNMLETDMAGEAKKVGRTGRV